jgi:hypothetical protein
MIFSLDSITENSKLNLIQTTALPIIVKPSQLELGDEFSYQFYQRFDNFVETFVKYLDQKLLYLIMMVFVIFSLNQIQLLVLLPLI